VERAVLTAAPLHPKAGGAHARIRTVDPPTTALLFGGLSPVIDAVRPGEWAAYCKSRGIVALVAEVEEDLIGWAVAGSCPHRLHIRGLEGGTAVCRLLLDRLVRAAGERDLSGWAARDRADVRRMFRRLGFAKGGIGARDGVPSVFYFWNRNADV
jgi:hypothetical protein